MNLHARKALGQNFLHDRNIVAKIIAAIAPAPEDTIVEIGGGLGALSLPLAAAGATLHVIEVDDRLAPLLAEQLAAVPGCTVHQADALAFDYGRLCAPGRRLRIVGNLPYNISTPLLFHLLRFRAQITDLHLMLQKEVVERMAATHGSREYGRLTVMLARWMDIEACFDIRPGSFRPAPRVMSSLARLTVRPAARFAVADEARFAALVAHLFSQRRKTLARALRGRLTEADIVALGIDPRARAETLPPASLADLAAAIAAGEQR